jgi:hypothetical protein
VPLPHISCKGSKQCARKAEKFQLLLPSSFLLLLDDSGNFSHIRCKLTRKVKMLTIVTITPNISNQEFPSCQPLVKLLRPNIATATNTKTLTTNFTATLVEAPAAHSLIQSKKAIRVKGNKPINKSTQVIMTFHRFKDDADGLTFSCFSLLKFRQSQRKKIRTENIVGKVNAVRGKL